jgi:hypothetical protein
MKMSSPPKVKNDLTRGDEGKRSIHFSAAFEELAQLFKDCSNWS